MVDITLLHLFVKVADAGSIAAAARQLDLAPSIASRRIAALERALKTRLLIRTTRRLSLTQAGQTLLEWARTTTTSFEEIADELGALQERPSGVIRLASNDYAAITYLPDILRRFCARYPDVRVQVSISNEPMTLLKDECDLAIHAGRMPDVNLIGRKIRQYRRRLFASPGYLEARGRPETVGDLADHDCLSHSASERLNWAFERDGEITTLRIEPYIEVDNYLVLRQLAVSGMGIARLAEDSAAGHLERGELVEVLPGHGCVYADGGLPAMWLIFADRRILHRTRLVADFLAKEISGGFVGADQAADAALPPAPARTDATPQDAEKGNRDQI
jgi:DNA-binding transcriptional LysR family regulator